MKVGSSNKLRLAGCIAPHVLHSPFLLATTLASFTKSRNHLAYPTVLRFWTWMRTIVYGKVVADQLHLTPCEAGRTRKVNSPPEVRRIRELIQVARFPVLLPTRLQPCDIHFFFTR
ncbi:hypothetical protein BDW62DRAFT_36811 [Aspergillus aurantiobrunneus]